MTLLHLTSSNLQATSSRVSLTAPSRHVRHDVITLDVFRQWQFFRVSPRWHSSDTSYKAPTTTLPQWRERYDIIRLWIIYCLVSLFMTSSQCILWSVFHNSHRLSFSLETTVLNTLVQLSAFKEHILEFIIMGKNIVVYCFVWSITAENWMRGWGSWNGGNHSFGRYTEDYALDTNIWIEDIFVIEAASLLFLNFSTL